MLQNIYRNMYFVKLKKTYENNYLLDTFFILIQI